MSPLDTSDITARLKPLVCKCCHQFRGCCGVRGHALGLSRVRFSPAEGGNPYFITGQILFLEFGLGEEVKHDQTCTGSLQGPAPPDPAGKLAPVKIPMFDIYVLKHHILMASTVTPDGVVVIFWTLALLFSATCVNDFAPSSGKNIRDLLQQLKSWNSLFRFWGG